MRHHENHEEKDGRRFARRGHWLGHEHGHGRHRHGGLRRLFEHGELRFVILRLIAEKPRYGYEIIKAIEEKVGGSYSPSPGVIYPTLTMLEELGYATVEASEGGKKLYAITDQGRQALNDNRVAIEAILARMAKAQAEQGGEPAPPILRAMENLKLALRLRLARATSEEQVRAIAAALDAAATQIEQS